MESIGLQKPENLLVKAQEKQMLRGVYREPLRFAQGGSKRRRTGSGPFELERTGSPPSPQGPKGEGKKSRNSTPLPRGGLG